MKYVFILFMAGCNFYNFTYGLHLWKKDHNKLGGAVTITLAILATLLPAIVVIRRL